VSLAQVRVRCRVFNRQSGEGSGSPIVVTRVEISLEIRHKMRVEAARSRVEILSMHRPGKQLGLLLPPGEDSRLVPAIIVSIIE
jgi:hypothetical protein